MKILAITLTALALSGCIGPSALGPTRIPSQATAAMWSNKTAQTVSSCIARIGDLPDLAVKPLHAKDSSYQTVVIDNGSSTANGQTRTAIFDCL
jgi:hypothetical protein